MYLRFFIHLSTLNNAAMNVGVHILFQIMFWISSDKFPEVESLCHTILNFCEVTPYCFSPWLHQSAFPSSNYVFKNLFNEHALPSVLIYTLSSNLHCHVCEEDIMNPRLEVETKVQRGQLVPRSAQLQSQCYSYKNKCGAGLRIRALCIILTYRSVACTPGLSRYKWGVCRAQWPFLST